MHRIPYFKFHLYSKIMCVSHVMVKLSKACAVMKEFNLSISLVQNE